MACSLVSELHGFVIDAGEMRHVTAWEFVRGLGAVKEVGVADGALSVEGMGDADVIVLSSTLKKGTPSGIIGCYWLSRDRFWHQFDCGAISHK